MSNILSEPDTLIPVKCSICRTELNPVQVELHMDDVQREIYIMHRAMKEVDAATEAIVNCPFCNYFEIWLSTCTSSFFYCKRESCKKVSCSVCHKEVKVRLSLIRQS